MYEYGNLNTLNIEDVLPNRFQPRIHFDESKLNELAESIRKYGVIQPIVVRQIGDKYEIIAGERRYKASKIANKSTIPAIVINLNDKESEEIALLENIQRQNLTPIEEAVSYKRILDMGYITQVELAEKLGKTQSTIANKVRLLNLDDQVQYALLNGQISERHARSLLRLHDRNKQVEMLNKIINERLTVKKTDDAIQEMLEEKVDEVVIPENQVKKPVFVKSEPVEELFSESEPLKKSNRAVPRGSHEIIRVSLPKDLEEKLMGKDEKGMDIDKIMREAQDINMPEENKDISNLMKNENNVIEIPANPVEPIVSMPEAVIENDIPLVKDEQNKFVNFSGIIQEEKQPEVEPVTAPSNEVSFDSIFNQMPASLQPSNPEPVIETPVVPEPAPQPAIEPLVQESVTQSSPEMQQQTVEPVMPEQPLMVNNNQTLSQTEGVSIAEAVKNAMNSQLPEEPTVVSPMMEESSLETPMQNVAMPRISTIQPKTLINNENEGAQSPLYSELVQNQMPTNPESISTPVDVPSEPLITNIPDSDILEAPVAEIMNSNINTSTVSEPVNNNNFIEVIRLIRNCADQIERLGYKIDVDEIDLGNSYQANFKIDKQ